MSLKKTDLREFHKDYSWQEKSVECFISQIAKFYSAAKGQFPLAYVNEVSPSGGKTVFSMKLARQLMMDGLVDRAIWIVPRDSIKLGFDGDVSRVEMPEKHRLLRDRHFRVDTELKSTSRGTLRNHHGLVITYQALPGLLDYLDLISNVHRLMFIFDEAHHGRTGETDDAMSIWGAAMEQCRRYANAVVCMTGTPLRSDAQRVALLRYRPITASDGRSGYEVETDFSFSYQKAVAAGIARRIICKSQDTEITYQKEGVEYRLPVSQIPNADLKATVKNTPFCFNRGVVDDYLQIAYQESERMRKAGDDDAAILVIGARDFDNQSSSLAEIAKRIQALFRETAVTVESDDGPDAREVIRQFKKATTRWIVAKEMISEGTNLPRLRIVVILRDIGNRVFYEQLVHRITRNDADDRAEDAIIIQLQLQHLHDWGKNLEKQALIGWDKRKKDPLDPPPPGPTPPPPPFFEGICAKQQSETIVIDGEDYTRTDPLACQLFERLGQSTGIPRWGMNYLLKDLDEHGALNPTAATASKKDDIFDVREKIKRLRELAKENCQKAGWLCGGGEAYRTITAQCKKAADIPWQMSIDDVERSHAKPLEAMERYYEATCRALANAKANRARSTPPTPNTGDQGVLL